MNNKYLNEVKDTWGNSASFKEYEEKTKSPVSYFAGDYHCCCLRSNVGGVFP